MKKNIDNPDYDKLVAERLQKIEERSEEYKKAMEDYEKKIAEEKAATEKKDQKKEEIEKPLAPINPPEVAKQVEITEKVPRVATMS